MAQSIVVSQGKSFTVELQSMFGSSPYGWCLSTLPKGIILLGTEIVEVPSSYQVGPVIQKFYFAAVSDDLAMTVEFVLAAAFCPRDIKDTYTVEVQVVPENPQQFVPYSENGLTNMKYGYQCECQDPKPVTDYGFISQESNPVPYYGYITPRQENYVPIKYGYPCEEQNNIQPLKYGYPCGEEPILKYGYPCGEEPTLKYGYPCGYNDASAANKPFFRRGSAPENKPFFRRGAAPVSKPSAADVSAMKAMMPYGMIYNNEGARKYGFPNC